ncbi:hypothetical protein GCM10009801_70130 [Streptomyces albiaxialis]|uniref:Restriction endonuclease type IV Mrr domain-containing protein n=1 Tax=Streptomyces albiaxialis TaxID=329523 RepID=A0ABP5IIY9_9ACTN
MAESVLVRCPVCRREHTYTTPVYPCTCGAPVALPVLRAGVPVQVTHRTWAGSWVRVRCGSCGRDDEWPQPEFGCDCGTVLRLPVAGAGGAVPPRSLPGVQDAAPPPRPSASSSVPPAAPSSSSAASPSGSQPPPPPPEAARAPRTASRRPSLPPLRRPAFRPVTIRTAQDAKTAAAQYLRWLGFTEIRVTERTPASGIDLRGPEVVAHVDPTTSPTALREIETLWLNGLNESAVAVCFSLAGYARDARVRADELALPLFVLDLTGTPQPVNDPADELIRSTP